MAVDTRVSITVDTGNAEGSLSRLRSAFDNLERSTDNASRGIDDVARSADSAGRHLNNAETQSSRLARAFSGIAKAGAVALGALSVAAVGVGHSIVETQREFDKLNAQLITATGSTENAAKAFKELQAFAKKTPYDLAQSVEGFAKLKNLGLEPSIDSLKSFGNTAAAMGKDLNQMVEAVADATTGEFERLKEFGIKSKSEGDKVTFTFQGVSKTVGKNAKEIQQYLLDIGNTQFAGAMDARAKSLDGAISSLGDSWKQLLLTVSQGGIGDAIADVVRNIGEALDGFTEKLKQPENVQMFKDALDGIGIAFGVIGGVIGAVASGLSSVYDFIMRNKEAFIALASGIGAAAAAFGIFTFVTAGIPAIMMGITAAVAGASSVFAILTSPITLTVLAIGALVAAGVLLYQNWDTIKAKAAEVWSAVSSKVTEVVANVKAKFEELKAKAEAVFNSLPAPARAALSAVGAVFSAQFSVIKSVVSTSFALIKNAFTTAFAVIKALVRGDMEGVKQAISNGMKNAWNIVRNGVTNIASAFKDLGVKLRQAGRDAVQGFINGINEKIEAAVAKMRELASRAKNAVTGFLDIRSPSRVMKQIGEWVSEGFAIGIAAKAPLAEKEATKLAEDTKKALEDELANLERAILVNTLKLKGDPNAEFTADVVSGKYGDAKNLGQLYQTKQQALDIEQQVKATESFNSTIADLNRQIALLGNSDPVKELLYDFQQTDKYAGYTVEQVQELEKQLIELGKAKVNADFSGELKKATDELNKQQYLLNNIGDKYAELTYSLAQKGFNTSQIEHIVDTTKQSDTMAQFRQWDAKNRDDALNADPLAKLKADFDAEMALITSFNEQKLLGEQEYLQRKSDLEAQFDAQSQALKVASYESQIALASGLAKDLLGESSRAYKAIFAVEKGMALAQVLLKNKVALANAWASAPFPANLPAVAKTLASTGALASAVSAIRPVIGQAHDGIMSVPKSGTWNLEKGERVLPQHTAKALDAKLDSMGSGRAVNVIIHNYTGEKVQQTTDSNGDIRLIIGEELNKQLPQHVNNPNSEFNRSLKNNYQLQRRL